MKINKLIFPKDTGKLYYKIHYQFVMDLFRVNKWCIELKEFPPLNKGDTYFECIINDKKVYFDYSDSGNCINQDNIQGITFKFHYKQEHKEMQNIFPMSSVSFYYKDWIDFNKLEKQIRYTCNDSMVLNNQRPYGNAIHRRQYVQTLLSTQGTFLCGFGISDQMTFWQKINNCLVSVCVPGQNNNMLDRGQLQQMAFGCCTISPDLPEVLPHNAKLHPMIHYIKCAGDYSDLIEKIQWCQNNRQVCIDIGNSAKKLFKKYLMPQSLVNWICEKI